MQTLYKPVKEMSEEEIDAHIAMLRSIRASAVTQGAKSMKSRALAKKEGKPPKNVKISDIIARLPSHLQAAALAAFQQPMEGETHG